MLVSFLSKRVGKVKRLITWVKNTINDKHVIGEEILSEVFTWINAAYYARGNTRSHMGGSMSMGYVIIHRKTLKHKTNVKRLAEA